MKRASKYTGYDEKTIKRRCISNHWSNFEFVPFLVVYIKRKPKKNRKKINKYHRDRRRNNSTLRLNASIGCGISRSLKGKKNGAHWETFVDYTLKELMAHLEKQFTEGMTWENYGKGVDKWNVDHKRPISSFNITSYDCQDFTDCWSLDNLQPLWQPDNSSKGNKLNWKKK